jgi:Tol biopolymer transport system component
MVWHHWSLAFSRGVGTLVLIGTLTGALAAQQVELVSRVDPSQVSNTGSGWDQPSSDPLSSSISSDGRYVVFSSRETNLVAGQQDVNFARDVFLRDLVTGTTTLVSRSMSSPVKTGNGGSADPVISADGRYVAFTSWATDLAPGQSGNSEVFPTPDLLLYDRAAGTTSVIASAFEESFFAPAISADGRYVAFTSDAEHLVPGQQGGRGPHIFLYDRKNRTFRLVSHTSTSASTAGDGSSQQPVISADGRFVVFLSNASDLVPGQLATGNVFLYDRDSGALTLLGPGSKAVMSDDGRFIAIAGPQSLDLYDRTTRQKTVVSDASANPAISADGRFVAFLSNDDNLVPGQQGDTIMGLFLYDRISRTFSLVSRRQGSPTVSGTAGTAVLSRDGRFVAFTSNDGNLIAGQTDANHSLDIFLFDRTAGTTTLASHASTAASTTGNALSYSPVISANGSRLVFFSMASDLLDGLTDSNQGQDVFAYEISSRRTLAVSQRAPEMPSFSPAILSTARALSSDGRWVAFESHSSQLVPPGGDSNITTDVFLYDRVTQTTVLVSRSGGSATRTANKRSLHPAISADGRYVAFASNATDIVPITPDPFGEDYKIFLFDRIAGTTELVARTRVQNGPESFNSFPVVRISPDGRYLAFTSFAADLVPGQREPKPFGTSDVFLWDRDTRKIVLVSRSVAGEAVAGNDGSFAPQLSADGRFVAFVSDATDLVPGQVEEPSPNGLPTADLFLYDRSTGGTIQVGPVPSNRPEPFVMSADGGVLAFHISGDFSEGIFLYERSLGTHQIIADAGDTLPSLSADGRYVAYLDHPFRQVFLYDRATQTSALVTRSSSSRDPKISADGRFVAFTSNAEDLVPGQTSSPRRENDFDVFLFDRESGTTILVDRLRSSPTLAVGGAESALFLSANGRQVAFNSGVDLVDGDFNLQPDAYLFNLDSPPPSPGPSFPCTLLDTHRAADAPALRSDVRRVVTVAGACGVPSTAKSITAKVTVLQGTGKGNLRIFPGNAKPSAKPSATLRFEKGQTRTASYTLPLATNGAGTLALVPFVTGKGTVHAVVEVTGFQ